MKSKAAPTAGYVAIGRIHWDVPVKIPLRPYVEFVGWLDEELDKLTNLWAPRSPPEAGLRRDFRPNKPR